MILINLILKNPNNKFSLDFSGINLFIVHFGKMATTVDFMEATVPSEYVFNFQPVSNGCNTVYIQQSKNAILLKGEIENLHLGPRSKFENSNNPFQDLLG